MADAVGMVEVSSIAMGYELQDAMIKAANVELLVARTICSGKYIVIVGGDVAAVESSVQAGVAVAREGLIDHILIPNVHPSVFPAITGAVELRAEDRQALGIIETFSAASAIISADAAVKTGAVKLFRIHIAMAIGGKGFVLVTGDVAAVEAAVAAGAAVAGAQGLLVNRVVIPGPRMELFREYV
ncbi:MAG: BMC domain-containing protein [Candidatus Sumerlaeia bacterium]